MPARMIITNDRDGAVEVAEYLESLGHRAHRPDHRPATLPSTLERGAGFLEMLAQRGIADAGVRILPKAVTPSNRASPAPSTCWR